MHKPMPGTRWRPNVASRALGAVGLALVCGMLMAGCASDASPTPTVTVTATATVTAGPIEVIEDAVGDLNTLIEFEMPDFTGWNLQEAQDHLQSIGSFLLNQEDATEQGRRQINDSNWTVCSQEPVPGTVHSKLAVVKLYSVKNDEVCP